jgi:tetratricopeptide (TPR) repeat protein
MIPMRRIWERKGEVLTAANRSSSVSYKEIAASEREVAENPDRRSATKKLLELYSRAGDLERAEGLVERWSARDPLDLDALIKRAEIAGRRGERAKAIRILGSVVDVRPSDVGAQERLARLLRWQGRPTSACRFSTALAEFRPSDEKSLAEALRCLGETGKGELARALRVSAAEGVLRVAERLLEKARPGNLLSGDLRVSASWNGGDGVDLDLGLIDPDAYRVSWLGAPTRAVISATNVVSTKEEELALRGGKPGEYVLEVSRMRGVGKVEGMIHVNVAGTQRQIPFSLTDDRAVLAVLRITTAPRLVPIR